MTVYQPPNGRNNEIPQPPLNAMTDVLELKLPLKPKYLQTARVAAGVIAGGMSFNYDEVVQVRVAVAEAFALTLLRTKSANPELDAGEVLIQFTVTPNKLEILVPTSGVTGPEKKRPEYRPEDGPEDRLEDSPEFSVEYPASPQELESEALLEALMDTVEMQREAAGNLAIRLVKYLTANQA